MKVNWLLNFLTSDWFVGVALVLAVCAWGVILWSYDQDS